MSGRSWYCAPCHLFVLLDSPCERCGRYRGSLRLLPRKPSEAPAFEPAYHGADGWVTRSVK